METGFLSATDENEATKKVALGMDPGGAIPPYPGFLIRRGERGAYVSQIQSCLNQVNNARLSTDGVFGALTEAAVINYQRVNGLATNGIVGPITWDHLMGRCFGSGGSGQAPPYPGFLIQRGARGNYVSQIQSCLNQVNNAGLSTDGVFGALTEAAVINYQRANGLATNGIVGPITWDHLMERCFRTQPPVPPPPPTPPSVWPPYPGVLLMRGMQGPSIRQVQERLNALGASPRLSTDGVFGQLTEAAVMTFQRANGLTPDGVVGAITWNRLFSSAQPPISPPPLLSRTIVIDPGHGGADVGATLGTRRESDDVLRLSLAVQRLLQAQGQRVIMTRSTDVAVTLTERSAISNRNNANLFVSIHRNASTSAAANGVDNFVFTTAPTNTVQFAFNVLDQVVDAGVQNNRGVMRANFAVLRNTNAPAMLLEMGFITNANDNRLFDQNFNAYAAAIARGIMNSLNGVQSPQPYFFYNVVSGDNLASLAQRFGTTQNAIITLNKLTTNIIIVGQVLKIPSR